MFLRDYWIRTKLTGFADRLPATFRHGYVTFEEGELLRLTKQACHNKLHLRDAVYLGQCRVATIIPKAALLRLSPRLCPHLRSSLKTHTNKRGVRREHERPSRTRRRPLIRRPAIGNRRASQRASNATDCQRKPFVLAAAVEQSLGRTKRRNRATHTSGRRCQANHHTAAQRD